MNYFKANYFKAFYFAANYIAGGGGTPPTPTVFEWLNRARRRGRR